MRKKSLEILNKQQTRMTEYLMRDFDKSTITRADYDKIIDRVNKIERIYYTYRNRIYKLHGLDLRKNKDIKKRLLQRLSHQQRVYEHLNRYDYEKEQDLRAAEEVL